MNTRTRRLERLEEKAGGGSVKALTALWHDTKEEDAWVTFCEPAERKGDRMPLKEFQEQFPDAELKVIRFVHKHAEEPE